MNNTKRNPEYDKLTPTHDVHFTCEPDQYKEINIGPRPVASENVRDEEHDKLGGRKRT